MTAPYSAPAVVLDPRGYSGPQEPKPRQSGRYGAGMGIVVARANSRIAKPGIAARGRPRVVYPLPSAPTRHVFSWIPRRNRSQSVPIGWASRLSGRNHC